MIQFFKNVLALAFCLTFFACSMKADMSGGLGSGDLGATPGGAQDVGLARDIIASGGVPTTDQFTIEGLYSEHNLALPDGPACEKTLCIGAAAALATGLDNQKRDFFIQLGMSTNISSENFERQPLNLGVVIDTSGSMDINLGHLKNALHAMVDVMRPTDRLAIIEFETEARVIQQSTLVSNSDDLHQAIDYLSIGGTTNMEAGMSLGYKTIDPYVNDSFMSRLMVFTDAMTNTGLTDEGSFQDLVTKAAERNIGFTFFGFGPDFDASFVESFAYLKGANYRFVGAQDVEKIFTEEFDFLVTPIAYDLNIKVAAPQAASLQTVYGIPGNAEDPTASLIEVKTVFLSKDKGALVLRLDGAAAEQLYTEKTFNLGQATLQYETVQGQIVNEIIMLTQASDTAPSASEPLYPSPEIQRTVAVTNMYLAMVKACNAYNQNQPLQDGLSALTKSIAELNAAYEQLKDDNLLREVNLLTKLKGNIENAKQSN